MNTFWEQFTFYALAVLLLGSALMVVTLRNIVHCAFFLMMAFLGVAGIFVLLYAEFIAGVQVLIYVGAITVLILFAIMLTQKILGVRLKQNNTLSPLGVVAGVSFFALVGAITFGSTESLFALHGEPPVAPRVTTIAETLLGNGSYVLPFEVASLLLLVAMVGAIVIAREKDQ